jgi:hypothetical protein
MQRFFFDRFAYDQCKPCIVGLRERALLVGKAKTTSVVDHAITLTPRYAMSIRPDNTLISNREMLLELLATPFRALGTLLHYLAENNSRTQALQAIAAIPEAELRAKGLTRADAISMAFRHDA